MIVSIIKDKKEYLYKASDVFSLKTKIKEKLFTSFKESLDNDKITINIKNDKDDEILYLLVIFSPIFITIFDNSTSLEFFKKSLQISNFDYGLYPYFFEGFDKKTYFDFYKNKKKNEDIILNEDNSIDFTINYIEDEYLLSLVSLMEVVFNPYNRKAFLDYFKKIRNDIVINGRRSILANDIYAFYLSKYLINWALDLMKIARYKDKKRFELIRPIYELTNNLKRPIIKNSL